jgi:hypothetical protein
MAPMHHACLALLLPAMIGLTGCNADVSEVVSINLKANQTASVLVTGQPVQADILNYGPGDVGVVVKRGDGSVSQEQVITGMNNLLLETTDVNSIVLTNISSDEAKLKVRALNQTRVSVTGPTDLPRTESAAAP